MFEALYKKAKSAIFENEEEKFLRESLELQKTMDEDKNFVQKTDEVAPPGWEGTVKAMKKHKDLKNPWALAWYMKGKGAHPHHKESVKESGQPLKISLEISDEDVQDIVNAWGGIKDIPLFVTAAAEHILGRYLHPEYLNKEDFEEFIEGSDDELPPKDKSALDAEQGDMPPKESKVDEKNFKCPKCGWKGNPGTDDEEYYICPECGTRLGDANESKHTEQKIIIEYLKKKDPATLTEKEKNFLGKFGKNAKKTEEIGKK